jgi:putative resolvase
MPVPARKIGPRTVLVEPEPELHPATKEGIGVYARVSAHDQANDLQRQKDRLTAWAEMTGKTVVRVETEIGSGMNGRRPKLQRLLSDPAVTLVVVEHRDRLGRMNVELVEAALAAQNRRVLVLDGTEGADDLVRDMVEVLTSFCARLYGRRGARQRAERALACTKETPLATPTLADGDKI